MAGRGWATGTWPRSSGNPGPAAAGREGGAGSGTGWGGPDRQKIQTAGEGSGCASVRSGSGWRISSRAVWICNL